MMRAQGFQRAAAAGRRRRPARDVDAGERAETGRSGAAALAGRNASERCGKAWSAASSASISSRRSMRTISSTAIAAVIAIPLGILLGSSEKLYRSVEFLIDFFRSTPASAMFPLFLVLFGVGDRTKISVAAFGAGLVILFNVAYGVMNARKTRLLAARVMGASRLRVLFDVMLLESLPQTFVGLRNGVSLALVIIVVAEMFIGSRRRPRPARVRGAAAVRHARHVCRDLCRRRARLRAQSAVPADRAPLRALGRALKRDEIWLNHHRALASCLSMIFSENQFTLFRIML